MGKAELLRRHRGPVALLVALALVVTPGALAGDADDLDTTYDGDGRVVTDFEGHYDFIMSLALQGDDKVIAVGNSVDIDTPQFVYRIAIARYDTDGSLDEGFSGDGVRTVDFPGTDEYAYSSALAPDGTLVVVGGAFAGSSSSFAIARFGTDGANDAGFSGDGRLVLNPVAGRIGAASDVAVQANGKIVVVGDAYVPDSGEDGDYELNFSVVRLNTDGTLDSSFSGDGVTEVDLGTSVDAGYSVAIDGDGKIVVAGRAGGELALVRLDSGGTLDGSFSGDGIVKTPYSRYLYGSAVEIQSDGKIVVAGASQAGDDADLTVVRYEADGDVDPGFAEDGFSVTDFGQNEDNGSLLGIDDATGNIYAGGSSEEAITAGWAAVMLDSDGERLGRLTNYSSGRPDYAGGLAVQSDGKLVMGGTFSGESNYEVDFALARYLTVVDDEAPNTSLDVVPPHRSTDATPTFEFSASLPASTFECILLGTDAAAPAFEPCASPLTLGPLPDGGYVFRVRAVGPNGEADRTSAPRFFSIDTVAPVSAVSVKVRKRRATVTPRATDPYPGTRPFSFVCSLDDGPFEACAAPTAFNGLGNGKHKIEVVATDAVGNVDESPATKRFKIGGKRK